MLGHLKMGLDECEKEYRSLSKEIFTPKRHRGLGRGVDYLNANGKFDGNILENSIREVIAKYSTSSEVELLSDPEPQCKVYDPHISSSKGIPNGTL